MSKNDKLIFLHGLEGSSQGVKATLLRKLFPEILTPDFRGSLEERMETLEKIVARESGWLLIGSSFGGLMATIFAARHSERVDKLFLFAPALLWPDFAHHLPDPIAIPTVIYHGTQDKVIPLKPNRELAQAIFANLDFRVVEDDHGLYKTVHEIDWYTLLGRPQPGEAESKGSGIETGAI